MTPRVSPGSSNTMVVEVIFPLMISQDRQMLVYVTHYIRTRIPRAHICVPASSRTDSFLPRSGSISLSPIRIGMLYVPGGGEEFVLFQQNRRQSLSALPGATSFRSRLTSRRPSCPSIHTTLDNMGRSAKFHKRPVSLTLSCCRRECTDRKPSNW